MKKLLLKISIILLISVSCVSVSNFQQKIDYIDSPKKLLKLQDELSKANQWPKKYINSIGMSFILVPNGVYQIGSPFSEEGRHAKEVLHYVKLTRAYYIAETEITQEQWKQLFEEVPAKYLGDKKPIDQVIFADAFQFADSLSEKEKIKYRIPTEAEWEIACRAGSSNVYSGSNILNEMGWYHENSEGSTQEVKKKSPNHLGLYDMHGNVWEWCIDKSGKYEKGFQIDPVSKKNAGGNRVRRGGSFATGKNICRSAYRNLYAPLVYRHANTGFRLVFHAEQLNNQ